MRNLHFLTSRNVEKKKNGVILENLTKFTLFCFLIIIRPFFVTKIF